jgi:molybdopterin molybdotransferase
MTGFHALIGVEEAVRRVLEFVPVKSLEVECVSLEDSVGRVCGVDIVSPADVPEFDRAAVDGYAVRSRDVSGASATNPVRLVVVGTSFPGDDPSLLPEVAENTCVEIMTGGPVPKGADAVVMAEHCVRMGGYIDVLKQVHPYQNISRRGEDYRVGEVVVRKGTKLRPWHVAALASLNVTKVPVFRKLRVGVMSTGSELVEPGTKPRPGQTLNSSKPMLKALLAEHGCEALDYGTIGDDFNLIVSRIREALTNVDMLIVTGGTSVGERDLVPEAVNAAGEPGIIFHGVRMRPGKPTGVGVVDGKPVIMVSGMPVAALIGFTVFVKPLIERFYGAVGEPPCKLRARLSRRVTNLVGYRSYMRVKVVYEDGEYIVHPLMLTGSGLLSTLTKANAILVIPEDVEGYDEGEEVEVELLEKPVRGGTEKWQSYTTGLSH